MLVSSFNDDYSFGNEKRLAINICAENETGKDIKPKEIEKMYKNGDYKGIIFRGETFKSPEITTRQMAYLCDLIEEAGGDNWAETKLDIEKTIKNSSGWIWYFLTCLDYVFNVKDNEIWEKNPLSLGKYHWKTIGSVTTNG